MARTLSTTQSYAVILHMPGRESVVCEQRRTLQAAERACKELADAAPALARRYYRVELIDTDPDTTIYDGWRAR